LSVVLVLFGHGSLFVTSEDCDLATGHRPGWVCTVTITSSTGL